MPQPSNPAAYQDLIEGILFPTLDRPKGTRVTCLTQAEAFKLKMRLHAAIKTLKRQSLEIYPDGHPSQGRSPFDNFVLQVEGTVLFVRPATAENLEAKLQAKIEEIFD